jgi:putative methyltransferase (TIGR04325 family)
LNSLSEIKWNVIEQAHYVDAGRKHIQDDRLRFYKTIDECVNENQPNVILISSVLQYMPNPGLTLEDLFQVKAAMVIFDRTIVNYGVCDSINIQYVPESIYAASYPCWSFSEPRLIEKLGRCYKELTSFASLSFPALSSIGSEFKGYMFTRVNNK